jgi:hydroxypyruvate reductase
VSFAKYRGPVALRFSIDRPEYEAVVHVFEAALKAVDAEQAVRAALRGQDGWPTVIAIGKAAAAMAHGFDGPARGIVITNHPGPVPDGFHLYLGGHPTPDETSVVAARAAIELIESSTGPVLFLVSGGASALFELPVGDLDIGRLAATTEALLRSGASIAELNCVRKHLSQVKGGRLAVLLGDRASLSLLLSDVVGDDAGVIGSGPTVPDPTSFTDALAIVARYDLEVPEEVVRYLEAGKHGQVPETPKELAEEHRVEVVANGATAAGAAAAAAEGLGISARVATTALQGDAAEAARDAIAQANTGMTFFAGETTVAVTGPGMGGRNQHAALAAAISIAGRGDMVFGALASDGVDGNTVAAGAVVNGGTVSRGTGAGLDATAALADHDSHRFLDASGDAMFCGPTGTNVGDLWVVWQT